MKTYTLHQLHQQTFHISKCVNVPPGEILSSEYTQRSMFFIKKKLLRDEKYVCFFYRLGDKSIENSCSET